MKSITELDLEKTYTYADYLRWSFEESVELIRGKIFRMAPAPNVRHQEVSANLVYLFKHYLWKHHCKLFHAPFDVRLPLPGTEEVNELITTVLQPDICVVCDLDKLDEKGCNGAPDLVIEILSPATSSRDLREKYQLYESSGVKEYWVIHPHEQTLQIFLLNEEKKLYQGRALPYVQEDTVAVNTIPGLKISLADVFAM